MEIKIQCIHFEASEALNENIEKKLQKVFAQNPFVREASVFLKLQENDPNKRHIMEIRLLLPQQEVFAQTAEANFYKALDPTIRKLQTQIQKYKQKVYANP